MNDTVIRSAEMAAGIRKLPARRGAPDVPPATHRSETPQRSPEERMLHEQATWRQQAQVELNAAREREERAGYEAGHSKGLSEAQASYREKLTQLDRLLGGFETAFGQQISALEDIAVAIATEVSFKLLGEAMTSAEGVRAMVVQALDQARDDESLLLRLSPRDFYLLLKRNDEPLREGLQNIELVPDDRVQLGGCLIESASGTLDARLETQLAKLRSLLIDIRSTRG